MNVGIIGASTSTPNLTWGDVLITSLNVATEGKGKRWREMTPRNWAQNGLLLGLLKSSIDEYIAAHPIIDDLNSEYIFLINSPCGSAATEAEFKADLSYIIDAILIKYPTAKIYIPNGQWNRDDEVRCILYRAWTDDVIALYPGQCFAGHKENIWKEGGDNGATMTYDGGHYSAAGDAECAAQWLTILGY